MTKRHATCMAETTVTISLIVFIGGGIGSVLRHAIGVLMGASASPWATLFVNAVGSLAIGLFGGLATRFNWSVPLRAALTVGLCGGFTTFSTFSKESLALMESGRWCAFAAYSIGSVAVGIAAVCVGLKIAK